MEFSSISISPINSSVIRLNVHEKVKQNLRIKSAVDFFREFNQTNQRLSRDQKKIVIQTSANQLYLEACEVYRNYFKEPHNIELYKAAKTLFKAAMNLNHPDACFILATFYLGGSKTQKGNKYLEKAIHIKPDFWEAKFALSRLYRSSLDQKKIHLGKKLKKECIQNAYQEAIVEAIFEAKRDKKFQKAADLLGQENFKKTTENWYDLAALLDSHGEIHSKYNSLDIFTQLANEGHVPAILKMIQVSISQKI